MNDLKILNEAISESDSRDEHVAPLIHSTQRIASLVENVRYLLRYIDSPCGNEFREQIAGCVIPGQVFIENVRSLCDEVGGPAS